MATKKIYLDFKQQLIATKSFKYKIYINGSIVTYTNSLNYLDINYKVGGNNSPFQIGIGTDLDDTIDNTLAFLNSSGYTFTGFVGGYSLTISYLRVVDRIEVTIDSSAPANLITVWEMISDYDYISFQTETPCSTIFLTNQSSANASVIFGQTSGNYLIRNYDTLTNKAVTIPSRFDCEIENRDNSYALQSSGGTTILTFGFSDSLNPINIIAYFSNNNLIITISQVGYELLGLLFSIDGTTFQTEPLFEDLASGDYTVTVKDIYGCQKTVEVTNSGQSNLNTVTPYAFISEANSLRFVDIVDHGNCGNYKNIYNTLSCAENLQIPYKYIQRFQTCDTNILTQIKTSYQNIEAYAIDTDGNETELTAVKIVTNIGLEDKRDCQYYTYNGKLAVLFTSGNTYEYGTTTVTGTYTLDGALPTFGRVGTWVETPYGNLIITGIRIDDNGQRSLILNLTINLVGLIDSTIQTIYNRDSFDIWELPLDMSDFSDKTFSIIIRFYQTTLDSNFPDRFKACEKIEVKTRHPRSKEIIWYNSENTDIYFYSGIQMKNRLNFCDVETVINDGSVEIEKTDTSVESIDAINYFGVDFECQYLTSGMVRKISLALRHNNLIIENIPYKLSQEPEISRMGKSNFYTLKAKLLEAGDNWNQGTANTQVIYSNYELIGYLQANTDEFIKI